MRSLPIAVSLVLGGPVSLEHVVLAELNARRLSCCIGSDALGTTLRRVGLLIAIALSLVVAGIILWAIWPARTGALAAGEKGNSGLIASAGEPDGGSSTASGE